MNIEIFFFLVYRQLFTFALLKTTRPPRSLFNYSYTKFVFNFQFEKSLIKYYYYYYYYYHHHYLDKTRQCFIWSLIQS